ncbi:Rhodanese-like domain-containing protein, partial [Thelonectria olida]
EAEAGSLVLSHFVNSSEIIPRITKETLAAVLNGPANPLSGQIRIIDCRFQHEYDGGHINRALNYDDHAQLIDWLFRSPGNGAVLIFHCEYSAQRAPIMASRVREHDRRLNADRYPHLTYESIYVLDGGYLDFVASYPACCSPQGYVQMYDERYWTACLGQRLARLKEPLTS